MDTTKDCLPFPISEKICKVRIMDNRKASYRLVVTVVAEIIGSWGRREGVKGTSLKFYDNISCYSESNVEDGKSKKRER